MTRSDILFVVGLTGGALLLIGLHQLVHTDWTWPLTPASRGAPSRIWFVTVVVVTLLLPAALLPMQGAKPFRVAVLAIPLLLLSQIGVEILARQLGAAALSPLIGVFGSTWRVWQAWRLYRARPPAALQVWSGLVALVWAGNLAWLLSLWAP